MKSGSRAGQARPWIVVPISRDSRAHGGGVGGTSVGALNALCVFFLILMRCLTTTVSPFLFVRFFIGFR